MRASPHRRFSAAALVSFLLFVVLGASAYADQVLELKDGRKITVTRLFRNNGQVLFETPKGERFSVPEGDVVAPPLASIPMLQRPAATAAPTAAPAPPAPAGNNEQVLELKDGRKITVRRWERRAGKVRFQTLAGENFEVPEADVVSPALSAIPGADAPAAPTAAPAATPEPTAAPATPAPPTPKPEATPAPEDFVPLPNRWDIPYPEDPRFPSGRLLDPYNRNVLKGDKAIIGNSVFLAFTGTIETPTEFRKVPVVGGVSTAAPGSTNPLAGEFFGDGVQTFTTPRGFASLELFGGQTAFKPKTWALKATGAFNVNYLRARENNNVDVDVREGKTRRRQHFSLEEAFAELKIADLSPNYDFVSVRAGIQPFVSDFRGLIFSDFNLGSRLFGSFANNRWSYNIVGFDLLEKETNSELNTTFERREQQVGIVNLFRQDTFTLGYTLSVSGHYSKDEASTHYDENGFLVRPAKIGVLRPHEVISKYVGLAGDGHFGRVNISHAAYYAFGTDDDNPLAGREVDIKAFFGALELSYDKDWARFRLAGVFASGDDDPLDEEAKGFDTIYDNSNFAGGQFSFWSRSGISLLQTGVTLKPPLSLLPSLRANKFEGQGNFVNPGLILGNASADVELTPKIKLIMNGNYLRFHKTEVIEAYLFQPRIRNTIGFDLGFGFLYRPLLNENILITAGATGLIPGAGFKDIFTSDPCGGPGCGVSSQNLRNVFVNLRLQY